MREAFRAKNAGVVSTGDDGGENDSDVCPELEGSVVGSVVGSETGASDVTQGASSDVTNSTAHSDGLLVEDEVFDQILNAAVQEVQMSLSSTSLNDPKVSRVTETAETATTSSEVPTKRDDELAGLQAAISNAVQRGSCGVEKLQIVEKVANQSPPEPESPPDAPRDPRDRRKRMRSGCFRYVCRSDVPNSIASLVTELKLTFDDEAIGLKLSEIFAALDGHMDKPLEDTWWGVS